MENYQKIEKIGEGETLPFSTLLELPPESIHESIHNNTD